jgi:aryl-alcohol dehydrogenase-like predicted oxidoreductase
MERLEYNLLKRVKVESEFAHLYLEVGLDLTVNLPLCSGMLTGKYRDGIPDDSRLTQTQVKFIAGLWKRRGKEYFDQMAATVKQLEPVAEKLGVSQSVLALA